MAGFGVPRMTGTWTLAAWGRRQEQLPRADHGHVVSAWLALRAVERVVPDRMAASGLELSVDADGRFTETGGVDMPWYDEDGVQQQRAQPWAGALGFDAAMYPETHRRPTFHGQILRLWDDVKIAEWLRWHGPDDHGPERLLRTMTAVIDDAAVDRVVYEYHRAPGATPVVAPDDTVPAVLQKPARGKKPLPDLWRSYGPLRLRNGTGVLGPDHVERLGRSLMAAKGHDTDALKEVRRALEPADRDAFGLALYEACVASAKPPPWLIRSLTLFAGERCVDRLFHDAPGMDRAQYLIAVEVLGEVADAHAAQRLMDLAAWIGTADFQTFALVQLNHAVARGAPLPAAPRPRDQLGWG